MNRPTGVDVSCDGEINGFGAPSFPLKSFDSECRAQVEVSLEDERICTGEGSVRGSRSIVSCEGLGEYSGEQLSVSARFYNGSENYANASSIFYNRN
ncbi:hypothetical protein [Candidatus Nanohalobium constans]|nr:hypothetical protein [Candidatus Nanohalobium constans]